MSDGGGGRVTDKQKSVMAAGEPGKVAPSVVPAARDEVAGGRAIFRATAQHIETSEGGGGGRRRNNLEEDS